ncbi:MAG: hypothetical protein RL151_1836 [Bacteroidota bacterium]
MYMRYILLIISLFLLNISQKSFAQSAEKTGGFERDRLFSGGNFGVRFGDNTFINLSPQVGYQFTDRFQAGAGINFITSSLTFRDAGGGRLYRTTYGYGGLNVFARVFPISTLFASVQPEYNYSWGRMKYFNGQPTQISPGTFVPVLLIGGGTSIPAGRGRLIAQMLYDVAGHERSPYGRAPFVSFGFNF